MVSTAEEIEQVTHPTRHEQKVEQARQELLFGSERVAPHVTHAATDRLKEVEDIIGRSQVDGGEDEGGYEDGEYADPEDEEEALVRGGEPFLVDERVGEGEEEALIRGEPLLVDMRANEKKTGEVVRGEEKEVEKEPDKFEGGEYASPEGELEALVRGGEPLLIDERFDEKEAGRVAKKGGEKKKGGLEAGEHASPEDEEEALVRGGEPLLVDDRV
jgi:hypothetical protein